MSNFILFCSLEICCKSPATSISLNNTNLKFHAFFIKQVSQRLFSLHFKHLQEMMGILLIQSIMFKFLASQPLLQYPSHGNCWKLKSELYLIPSRTHLLQDTGLDMAKVYISDSNAWNAIKRLLTPRRTNHSYTSDNDKSILFDQCRQPLMHFKT